MVRHTMMVAAGVLVLAAGQVWAVDANPNGEEVVAHDLDLGLGFLDARLGADEAPTAETAASLAKYRAGAAWALRQAVIAAMVKADPGVRVDDHMSLGTPQYVRSLTGFLTGPIKGDAKDVARAWIAAHADLLGVTLGEVDKSPMSADFVTHGGLMHHFTWQQAIGGIDVYGNELRVNVTGRGEVINAGSSMVPTDGLVIPARVLTDLDALRAAAANVGITMGAGNPVPGEPEGVDHKRTWERTADFGNQDPIESRMVYFARTRERIVPAWYVVVPVPGVGHTYEVVVDATNGDVLWRWDRLHFDTTQSATYRVYPSDSPSPGSPGRPTPDGVQPPHVSRALVTVTPAEIATFSPEGWINDGDNRTVGNNVDAYTDISNDNTASDADRAFGTPAPGRVFDFPANIAFESGDEPPLYRDAAITQMFYYSNRYHDRLLAMGFDEAARNFQTINFVTGTGGDAVRAEAQDGSGNNNANFATSGTDGSIGRCQMYQWTGPTPNRDGDFDSDIVYHELSHGLSIRLHRGGLTGTQGGGMGEGWGDFYGVCLNAEASDDFAAVYAMGGYGTYLAAAGYVNNYHYGIRRFPYSTDFTKSPLTYADCDTAQYNADGVPRGPFGSATANAVHNQGEVWCNTLLECRREIAVSQGFAANQIIMQLVVDGMKLAPSAPNMLQERDAILAADQTRYGGANTAALWRGFARRGMGFSAASPGGSSTAGIVEAFDLPERVVFTYPSGRPSFLAPSTPTPVQVLMTPESLTLTPGTQQMFVSVNGSAFAAVPMTAQGGNLFQANLPGSPCFADVDYYFTTGTSAGARSDPFTAPASFYSAQVQTESTVHVDTFETDLGWTAGQPGDTATTGVWERADPQGTAAQPEDDVSNPGTICWVTGATAGTGVGSFDVDGGLTTLLSPALPISGRPDARVSYWRWYSNNQGGAPNADTFRVEISANGTSGWLPFETVGPVVDSGGGWVYHEARVGDFVIPTNNTRLRFIAEDAGTGSVVEAALDEFRIFEVSCAESPCDPDMNQDGNVDQDDVSYLINVVGGGPNPTGIDPDFNQDGNVDQDDVGALINVVAGGDCP
jgi:hypothetical protein